MNIKEFEKKYLSYYLLLESDFIETFNYVSVESDNYKAYSNTYLKLLLAIGSEIDVIRKFIVNLFYPSFDEKKQNPNKLLMECFSDIKELEIKFKTTDEVLRPRDYSKEPDWWAAYNEIKHNRLEAAEKFDATKKYYQYANLENVILSLAALFSLELFAYKKIAEDTHEKLFVPIIKSIYSINNSCWENIEQGSGMVSIDGVIYMGD